MRTAKSVFHHGVDVALSEPCPAAPVFHKAAHTIPVACAKV
jgi:hypothetical protein